MAHETAPAKPRVESACRCGCREPAGVASHALSAALDEDDLDRALESGLLGCAPCPACAPDCTSRLLAARDERRRALAARARFRQREARLQRRDAQRAARRAPIATPDTPPPVAPDHGPAARALPALPPAVAAALARAKARAAERGKR